MTTARTGFPVTVHIIVRQNEKVLLLRRQNTGYRDGWFSLVAGHVDIGEIIHQAAVSEVMEEVGVALQHDQLSLVGVMHRKSGDQRIDFFLEAQAWQGKPYNNEKAKATDLQWVSLDRLPTKKISNISRALANNQEQFWFDEFGWKKDNRSRHGG